jgi:tetratricopeptide (TPR) repeat protein
MGEDGIPVGIIGGADREDYLLDMGPGTSAKYNAEDIREEENPQSIIVPGTGERLPLAGNVLIPRYDGIFYLKKAAELTSEKETLASVHYKIAEMYEWAGSKKMAMPYFEKSLALLPDNANTRLKLINIYTGLYKNSKALVQLNYLSDNGLINFNNRLLFAKFNILAGNFDKASKLLNKADSIHPYFLPEIYNLYGLSNMLANKPKEAIAFYKSYLKADINWVETYYIGDSTSIDGDIYPLYARIGDKRSIAAYTLSRLYAKTANNKAALQWLETAIKYGFNYSFVLLNDPLMDGLRKTSKWQTLINGIEVKKYKSNKPVD